MPPYWEVDRPPPCDVLKLRGQTLKFGISGRGIISPPSGDAVLSDLVAEWDNEKLSGGVSHPLKRLVRFSFDLLRNQQMLSLLVISFSMQRDEGS